MRRGETGRAGETRAGRAGPAGRAPAARTAAGRRAGRALWLVLLGALLAALGSGFSSCRWVSTETDADDALVERLIGRWRGEAEDGAGADGAGEDGAGEDGAGEDGAGEEGQAGQARRAWWEGTSWDLVFSPSGELSAVAASVVGARPKELRFRGSYAVRYGKVLVEEPSLGGVWRAAFDKKTLRLEREGDVAQAPDPEEARLRLVLEPRFGEYRAR